MKEFIQERKQACILFALAVVMVLAVIFVRNTFFFGEQYIIGKVVTIDSGSAQLDHFDKDDGAYTGDPDKLYIRFETDNCEFIDEDGNPCEVEDIIPGSKVKMTSSSSLKTDKYGYTTVYIKKVEVLEAYYD
ncbi:MAG: hypothetical protein II828_06020 [Clostridia bacterium]|nr:hypothetical protein [Clostridia bacterium]